MEQAAVQRAAGADDLAACVALMRTGSRTFFAASRLLPPRVRCAAIALYAFCRVADDLVDDGDLRLDQALAQLGLRLDHIYDNDPLDHLEDRALAEVVRRHDLPRPLLDALLDGFAWDAQGRAYDTLEDLHDYGARVAGSVGAMMCWIMGVRSAQALARACELGVAMQLTNIARDVGEDARKGRLYLPRQWLVDAGIDADAWLARPGCSPALQSVVDRLLVEADQLYTQASSGIALLPRDCRSAILAARLVYAEIGQQLRRNGLDPLAQRAVVPRSRKLVLLACAGVQSGWVSRRPPVVPPLAAIAYLVEHCHASALALSDGEAMASASINGRVAWMLDLFERLEAQKLAQREGVPRAHPRLSH
ncbi:phytoene/squalene synthase family protein [Hydrogenophaga sp.]|uniref:phytoene/squalene synthase family protein n=1 Tax=Hydrogenophaga sp. TaxID=1904254 RepID=UPI0025C30541|nr:phytoene/squalene synthase family protein [Hydrogenophaga sp.]